MQGMNMKTTMWICILFCTITTLEAQIPYYIPTNGLVGWWPFNGNANDESGNGRDGSVNGPILTMGKNGQNNTAYFFDGIDDRLYLGNWFNYTTFTISMWVKPENQNGHAVLIDNNHSSNLNWVCQAITNWQSNGYSFINSSQFTLPTTGWSHLIFAYSNNQVLVYLNGSLISQTHHNLNYGRSPSLYLGYWQVDTARFWKGSIDDIAIWNRTLNNSEINALYLGKYCPPPENVRF
jgi:hypothetical protein